MIGFDGGKYLEARKGSAIEQGSAVILGLVVTVLKSSEIGTKRAAA